jgi:hypothetical protein
MKRYDPDFFSEDMEEILCGDWVRFEEAQSEIEKLRADG